MAATKVTYDVFISHGLGDNEVAAEIAAVFRNNHLEPFDVADLRIGEKIEDVLWEALSESRVVLAIFSKDTPTPSMALEIGAAKAWNKPIYGVVTEPSLRIPAAFASIPLYTVGRVEEIVGDVRKNRESLTDQELIYLIQAYENINVSVDRLALQPRMVSRISEQFERRAKRKVSGELLLWTLMRLRKQGFLSMSSKMTSLGFFELKTTAANKYLFNLKAGNGEIILTSQQYQVKSSAENGIESVRHNAPLDERFERKTSKSGDPYFVLTAANGQTIGQSEMYSSASAMENGIESVKRNAPEAKLKDLTAS